MNTVYEQRASRNWRIGSFLNSVDFQVYREIKIYGISSIHWIVSSQSFGLIELHFSDEGINKSKRKWVKLTIGDKNEVIFFQHMTRLIRLFIVCPLLRNKGDNTK